jgi:hypothetical protein
VLPPRDLSDNVASADNPGRRRGGRRKG